MPQRTERPASKVRRSTEGIPVGRARQKADLWYFIKMKKSEAARRIKIRVCWAIFLVALGSALACRAADGNGYSPILYPSIFWHNNQWETYEKGKWVPYRGSANNQAAVQSEPEMAPEAVPGPDTVDTNTYPVPYGWGFIGAPAFYPRHHHLRSHLRTERQRNDNRANGFGRPNVGIGKTTIGIGKPNAGIGQTTIGMGRPNFGVGQRNVGVGQPTIGIGQPNVGIGRNNSGIGQPNVQIGQPTIGIGQQMSSQPTWGTPRNR